MFFKNCFDDDVMACDDGMNLLLVSVVVVVVVTQESLNVNLNQQDLVKGVFLCLTYFVCTR